MVEPKPSHVGQAPCGELKEKLEGFTQGKEDIEDLYLGRTKRDNAMLDLFTDDKDLQKAMETWISKGKYGKLLELWVEGLSFD